MRRAPGAKSAVPPHDPRMGRMFAVVFQVLFTTLPVNQFDRWPMGFPMMW